MSALANENSATLAQGDADDALAPPMMEDEGDYLPGLASMGTLSRGLDLLTPEGEAEWQRRIEVHKAICALVGGVPLLPGFTEADLRTSKYRPWGANTPEEASRSSPVCAMRAGRSAATG